MNENDPRVIKTKENIVNQFIECLKEYSFQDITVKMLIERCRINRSTFYRNYEDKYDLLDKLLSNLLDELKECSDDRFITMRYRNAKEYHPYLYNLVLYFKKNRNYLLVLWSAALPVNFYTQMMQLMSARLADTIKSYYTIQPDNAHLVSLYSDLFAAITLSTMHWWLTEAEFLSCDEIIEIMTSNIEKGLFRSMEDIYLN